MVASIGLVANVYNEVNALPGWVETHLPFFDDVRIYHAGPQGEYSKDGTIELLEKWNIPITYGSIDEGFGAVRTKAVRTSPCDWVMILDADERFFPVHRVMSCSGESTPQAEVDSILQSYDFRDVRTVLPNWENVARLGAKLRVEVGDSYDQGAYLRSVLSTNPHLDVMVTIRRHWHDFSFQRPTQNWHTDPDWQMRLLRNSEHVYFDPTTRMHERLLGARNKSGPDLACCLYFDHFHFTFKRMEVEQRAHDIKVYDAIHEGRCPPTLREFLSGVK